MGGAPGLSRDAFLTTFRLELQKFGSPEARSAEFARFAGAEIAKATTQNAAALGQLPPPRVTVDGRVGAPLAAVKPDGVIVANFDLMGEVLEWIGEQLLFASPFLTGRFERSFLMLVEGVEHDLGKPVPQGAEVMFVNTQPYARKIERGISPQSPDGVFEVVAKMAARQFGNTARVFFTFRSIQGGAFIPYVPAGKGTSAERAVERDTRTPAIVVVPR